MFSLVRLSLRAPYGHAARHSPHAMHSLVVDDGDAVVAPHAGSRGAGVHTRGLLALHARVRHVRPTALPCLRAPFVHVQVVPRHPRPLVVLHLARHHACAASCASAQVDGHSVPCHPLVLSPWRGRFGSHISWCELYAGPRASSRSARNNRFPYFALPRGWQRHHRFLAYARFKHVKGTGDLTRLNLVGDERHVCQIARPFDTRHTLFGVGGKPPQVIVLSWGFTMQRGWPSRREREPWQPSKSIDPS